MFITNRFFYYSPQNYIDINDAEDLVQELNFEEHDINSNTDGDEQEFFDALTPEQFERELPVTDYAIPKNWDSLSQQQKKECVQKKVSLFQQKMALTAEIAAEASLKLYKLTLDNPETLPLWNKLSQGQKNKYIKESIALFLREAEIDIELDDASRNAEPSNWLVKRIWGLTLPITLPITTILSALEYPVSYLTSTALKFTEKHPHASFAISLALVLLYLGGQGVAAHQQVNDARDAIKSNTDSNADASPAKTTVSDSMHASTMRQASDAIEQGAEKFTTIGVFKNRECLEKAKDTIFKAPSNLLDSIQWEQCFSDASECGMIAKLDLQEFFRTLGHAAGKGAECVSTLSVDPISLPQTQEIIRRQAKARDIQEKLAPIKNETEACIPKSAPANLDKMITNDGQTREIYQAIECRPLEQVYTEPSQEIIESHLGKLANSICIKRLAVISNGLEGEDIEPYVVTRSVFQNSTVSKDGKVSSLHRMNASLPLENNQASKLARIALKSCNRLNFDDVRATEIVSTTDGNSQYQSAILSVSRILQSLGHILGLGADELPESVMILDVHEVNGYLPDTAFVQSLVNKLNQLKIDVYAYAPSKNSWLSHISGIKTADKMSQITARTVRVKRSLPEVSVNPETTAQTKIPTAISDPTDSTAKEPDTGINPAYILAPLGVVVAAGVGIGVYFSCKTKKKDDGQNEEKLAEEIPLQQSTAQIRDQMTSDETAALTSLSDNEVGDCEDDPTSRIHFHRKISSVSNESLRARSQPNFQ